MSATPNVIASSVKPTEIIAHWAKLIEGFEYSPQEFYAKVESALQSRQVPALELSRVDWPEGGPFSPKREYLRICRERLAFDVCASPFGTGFFVSSWCTERSAKVSPIIIVGAIIAFLLILYESLQYLGFLAAIGVAILLVVVTLALLAKHGHLFDSYLVGTPLIGSLYRRFFRRLTYYRIDQMEMYRQAVHCAVTQVIDEITSAKGMAPLSESERKPILVELYRR